MMPIPLFRVAAVWHCVGTVLPGAGTGVIRARPGSDSELPGASRLAGTL